MHEVLRLFLIGVTLPLPLAATLLLAARWFDRRDRRRSADLMRVLAVALPMPIAFAILEGVPIESWERLIVLSVLGAAVGQALAVLKPPVLRTALIALGLAAAVTVALWPAVKIESWPVRLTPGVAAALLVILGAVLAKAVGPRLALLAFWAAAVATGLGVILMGQMPMAAAVAPIGAAVIVFALAGASDRPLPPGVLAAIAAPVAAAPALAWMWMSVTGASYALWVAMLAPFSVAFAIWVAALPRRRATLRAAATILTVLAFGCGSVAVMYALDDTAETETDLGDLPDFMQYPQP